MNKDMYFLPLLARAFDHPNGKKGLVDAFRQIQELGKQTEYRDGYAQFLTFMDRSQEFAMEAISSDVEASDRLFSPSTEGRIPRMALQFDEQNIGDVVLGETGAYSSFKPIKPGLYRLRLETGWVVWEEQLEETDLLWRFAFPDRPVLMAADTEGSSSACSREYQLFDGLLVIQIHPGFESGVLNIRFNQERRSTP